VGAGMLKRDLMEFMKYPGRDWSASKISKAK